MACAGCAHGGYALPVVSCLERIARLSLNERGLSVPLMLFGSYSWWNSLTAGQHEAHIPVGHQKPLKRLTGTILPQAVNLALSLPLYISVL